MTWPPSRVARGHLRGKTSCSPGGPRPWAVVVLGVGVSGALMWWAAERSAWLSPASGQGLGLWLKDKTWVQVCSGVSGCQAGVGTGMGACVGRSVLP